MHLRSAFSVIAVVLLLASGLALPVKGAPEHSRAKVLVTDDSADIVVEVKDASAFDTVVRFIEDHGVKAKSLDRQTSIMTFEGNRLTEREIESISTIPGVLSVSSALKARTLYTPNDPSRGLQWGLDTIHAYQAWDITLGRHSVVVGVLDTGIDWNHPDIAPNMWNDGSGHYGYNTLPGYDVYDVMDDNINSYDESGNWAPGTYTYHGTHVAGVVGAAINNGAGVAGIAQVSLMAVKVMNDSGEGTDASVASGIRWAVDHGANVITMSLGVDGMSLTLGNAVGYASSHGVVMVAASGNSGSSFVSYPAAYPAVIAVGAIDQTSRRASFSNFGTELDIMAPGVAIYSTQGSSGYQYLSGTSTAAPYVAGVAALMLTVNPSLPPVDIGAVVNATATDLTSTVGWDTSTGWGVVNAFAAVQQVANPTVRISTYPSYVKPNSTFSITWSVSGGDPGTISSTYLRWGTSPSDLSQTSAVFTGTTFEQFTVDNISSLPTNGTIYAQAFATIDGTEYSSSVVDIPVHEAPNNGMFSQFIENLRQFIFNDFGLANFLVLLAVLIAIPIVVIAARSRSNRRARAQAFASTRAFSPPAPAAPLSSYMSPPPPPPPPRYEAYIDLVGHEVMPASIRIVEGTKVVWVNRNWAPPPGISIRSGKLDQMGEHPDGTFQSGMLIAPGDYWSATFHRVGTYEYYLTGIWKSARVIVEPYRPGMEYRSAS